MNDVVAIPVSEDEEVYALVAGKYLSAFYVAVLEGVHQMEGRSGWQEAIDAPVMLVGLTFDAKALNGQWPVIGTTSAQAREIPLPAYRVDDGGQALVEDHTGKHSRRATGALEQGLRYRELVSPQLMQDAVRARQGRADWLDDYDALVVPEPGARSSDIFPHA